MTHMLPAYAAAARGYRETLALSGRRELDQLNRLASAHTLVVAGNYDRAEDVLGALSVPYRSVRRSKRCAADLRRVRTIIVNCSTSGDEVDVESLRRFVAGGGTIVTTDWALFDVVEEAFPCFIEANGQRTADDVVSVELGDAGQRFLGDLVTPGDEPRWWLELSSHPIRILRKRDVDVLIQSREMGRRYGDDPIAVRFRHGGGWVYHLVSHLNLQRTKAASAREQASASGFLLAKGAKDAATACGDVRFGELAAAYLSVGLLARILTAAREG
ncbi:MAG: hypothetical protein HY369_03680 [Candidatus Aenigmarchaeota archaeon]|nr:hypothetical protein [Candidatus Aenigmarchaeota archaeon]